MTPHFLGGAELAGKVADFAWNITAIRITRNLLQLRIPAQQACTAISLTLGVRFSFHWAPSEWYDPINITMRVNNWKKTGTSVVPYTADYLSSGLIAWLLYLLEQPGHPELLLFHTRSHQQHLFCRRRIIRDLESQGDVDLSNSAPSSPCMVLHFACMHGRGAAWFGILEENNQLNIISGLVVNQWIDGFQA